jgi:hypothetical protein
MMSQLLKLLIVKETIAIEDVALENAIVSDTCCSKISNSPDMFLFFPFFACVT